MAQKFILVILLFTFVLSANAWNLFRCNQDGSYTYLGDHEGSFNSAAEKIGYTSGQIYSFYGDLETQSDINFVGFRNLSEDVVFVLTEPHIKQLTQQDVIAFLLSNGFDYNKEYGPYSREKDLDNAIVSGEYTIDFICETLHLPLDKYKNASVIEDEQNGYRYYFTKGIMTQWEPLDGLNKWAKEGKENNPSIFYAMYNAAQQYWGSDEVAAIKEVNEQYDSSASIPIDVFKKYINYYREPEGFFNYRLCMSTHCERSLTLRELKDFSHNKCTYLQSISGNEANKMFYVYKYQYTLYCFDEGGNLVNAKLVE